MKQAMDVSITAAQASRGARLSQAMRRRGMTKLSVMAKSLNVTESAVSRWRRQGDMTLTNIVAVCTVLDVSADWLLLGRGTMDWHGPGDAARPSSEALVRRLPPDARELLASLLQTLLQHG